MNVNNASVTLTVDADNETIRFWTVVFKYIGRVVKRDWYWLTKSGDSWTAAKGLLGLAFMLCATVFIVILLVRGIRSCHPTVAIVVSVALIAALLLTWFIPAKDGSTIEGKPHTVILNSNTEIPVETTAESGSVEV